MKILKTNKEKNDTLITMYRFNLINYFFSFVADTVSTAVATKEVNEDKSLGIINFVACPSATFPNAS